MVQPSGFQVRSKMHSFLQNLWNAIIAALIAVVYVITLLAQEPRLYSALRLDVAAMHMRRGKQEHTQSLPFALRKNR